MSDPAEQGRFRNSRAFLYRGSSMRSTFLPGQVLYVHPEAKEPQPGDVVIFRKEDRYVVHRVVSKAGPAMVTRGDDNPRPDDTLVLPDRLIGVVNQIKDGEQMTSVPGGTKGLLKAQIHWKRMAILNWLRPVIGAPYRWLKRSRIIPKIWHPAITTMQVPSENGIMIKFIYRGKTVAMWLPELRKFHCERIYDLVIFPPNLENRRLS